MIEKTPHHFNIYPQQSLSTTFSNKRKVDPHVKIVVAIGLSALSCCVLSLYARQKFINPFDELLETDSVPFSDGVISLSSKSHKISQFVTSGNVPFVFNGMVSQVVIMVAFLFNRFNQTTNPSTQQKLYLQNLALGSFGSLTTGTCLPFVISAFSYLPTTQAENVRKITIDGNHRSLLQTVDPKPPLGTYYLTWPAFFNAHYTFTLLPGNTFEAFLTYDDCPGGASYSGTYSTRFYTRPLQNIVVPQAEIEFQTLVPSDMCYEQNKLYMLYCPADGFMLQTLTDDRNRMRICPNASGIQPTLDSKSPFVQEDSVTITMNTDSQEIPLKLYIETAAEAAATMISEATEALVFTAKVIPLTAGLTLAAIGTTEDRGLDHLIGYAVDSILNPVVPTIQAGVQQWNALKNGFLTIKSILRPDTEQDNRRMLEKLSTNSSQVSVEFIPFFNGVFTMRIHVGNVSFRDIQVVFFFQNGTVSTQPFDVQLNTSIGLTSRLTSGPTSRPTSRPTTDKSPVSQSSVNKTAIIEGSVGTVAALVLLVVGKLLYNLKKGSIKTPSPIHPENC